MDCPAIHPPRSWPMGLFVLFAALALACGETLAFTRHALLIGVSDYKVKPLEGPGNDIRSLYLALKNDHGFADDRITVLLDGGGVVPGTGKRAGKASKKGILDALEGLQRTTAPGDHIFIYFSGHGTSAKDKNIHWPLPYDTAALIPWGFSFRADAGLAKLVDELVVGRTDDPTDRDVRSLLLKLDDPDPARSRHIFVAVDACYSARAMRSIGATTRGYTLPYADEPDLAGYETMIGEVTEDYPYHNVFIVTAASEHEEALDLNSRLLRAGRYRTRDGEPHGAFTDALLGILSDLAGADIDGDGITTYGEVFDGLREEMNRRRFPHNPTYHPVKQQGGERLRQVALFGKSTQPPREVPDEVQPAADTGPLRVSLDGLVGKARQAAERVSGLVVDDQHPELRVHNHAGGISLCTQGGEEVALIESDEAGDLPVYLAHQVYAKKMRAHRNPKGSFGVSIDAGGSRQAGFALEGEYVAFEVSATEAFYPVLIDINPKGRVLVLYPQNAAEQVKRTAGSVTRLPPDDSFRIRVEPPFGIDDVVLVGLREPSGLLQSLTGARRPAGSAMPDALARVLMPNDPEIARAILQLKTQPESGADAGCR